MKKLVPICLIAMMLSGCDMISGLLGIQSKQAEQPAASNVVAEPAAEPMAAIEEPVAEQGAEDDGILLELDSIEEKLDAAESQHELLSSERQQLEFELEEAERRRQELEREVARLEALDGGNN